MVHCQLCCKVSYKSASIAPGCNGPQSAKALSNVFPPDTSSSGSLCISIAYLTRLSVGGIGCNAFFKTFAREVVILIHSMQMEPIPFSSVAVYLYCGHSCVYYIRLPVLQSSYTSERTEAFKQPLHLHWLAQTSAR